MCIGICEMFEGKVMKATSILHILAFHELFGEFILHIL